MKKLQTSGKSLPLQKSGMLKCAASLTGAFGDAVCDVLFGGMNVYALANGLPVWCNLMLDVMDEIDSSFAREQKATNPKLQKYLNKYQKYQRS